jgi:hypothetical protein
MVRHQYPETLSPPVAPAPAAAQRFNGEAGFPCLLSASARQLAPSPPPPMPPPSGLCLCRSPGPFVPLRAPCVEAVSSLLLPSRNPSPETRNPYQPIPRLADQNSSKAALFCHHHFQVTYLNSVLYPLTAYGIIYGERVLGCFRGQSTPPLRALATRPSSPDREPLEDPRAARRSVIVRRSRTILVMLGGKTPPN